MRLRRPALWAILVLAASPFFFLGAYAAATRWLLGGPKLRALINGKPQSFTIDWDEARSSWPGRVRIRNLRLRGSDPNVEWTVTLENAELRYSLLPLLRRTFQCDQLLGSGLAFALRSKIDPSKVKKVDVALLPPIPGFSDPPLKSPDQQFHLEPNPWKVDVRNVAIERFEDIWVNALRYQGPARVQGGFFLRPTHLVRIDSGLVRFDGGALRIGKAAEGLTITGSLATATKPFEPIQNPMPEGLRQFTTDLKIEAAAAHLETITDFIHFPEGVRLEGNGPSVHVDVAMREGIAAGKATVSVHGGIAQTRSYRLRGDLNLEVPFGNWNLMGPLTVDVSGTHGALTDVHASGPTEARGWWGRFEVPTGKVGAAADARVEVKCRDARPLLALFGVELPGWTKGLIELDDFSATARVSATPGTIRVRDLQGSGGNFKVQGRFAHDGKVAEGAFLIESGILVIGVEITPAATKLRPLFAKQWYEGLQKTPAPASGG